MNLKEHLRVFLIGMAMGVANIIPGVSGGTIAVVFGIYEKLMEALGKGRADGDKAEAAQFSSALAGRRLLRRGGTGVIGHGNRFPSTCRVRCRSDLPEYP